MFLSNDCFSSVNTLDISVFGCNFFGVNGDIIPLSKPADERLSWVTEILLIGRRFGNCDFLLVDETSFSSSTGHGEMFLASPSSPLHVPP